MKLAVTVNVFEAVVSVGVSFVVAVIRCAPPVVTGTVIVVVNAPVLSVSAHPVAVESNVIVAL